MPTQREPSSSCEAMASTGCRRSGTCVTASRITSRFSGANVQEEYERIRSIVAWTDQTAADWLDKVETVTGLIGQKP